MILLVFWRATLIALLKVAFNLVCIGSKCQWVSQIELLGRPLDIWVWSHWEEFQTGDEGIMSLQEAQL